MSVTVRGRAKVEWRPAFTLTFTSTDGLSLDPGTTLHPLVATLTNTADGSPVVGRTIRLATNPTTRTGDGVRLTTDVNGQVTFQVSNPSVESVVYTASLVPRPPTDEPTITANLTITWGGVICNQCNADLSSSPAERFGVDPVQGWGYSITYTVHTESGADCLTITDVTHATGFYYILPDGTPPDFSSYDVDEVTIEYVGATTEEAIDLSLIDLEIERLAAYAILEADQC